MTNSIEDLAESILREGFKPDKPLAGYVSQEDGVNVISVVDGHCRLEAVRIAISRGAEISRLPVVVSPPGTTMEDLTVSLVSSNSGKELTPYEISLVVRRLVRFGWETQEIATKLGITPRYVAGLLLFERRGLRPGPRNWDSGSPACPPSWRGMHSARAG